MCCCVVVQHRIVLVQFWLHVSDTALFADGIQQRPQVAAHVMSKFIRPCQCEQTQADAVNMGRTGLS